MDKTYSLHFVVAVWGRSYTDVFLDVVLPSQLTANNLPALVHKPSYVYKIYTTAEDARTIEASLAFIRLAGIMPVEIHVIHPDQSHHVRTASVRHTMGSLHKRAIQEGARDDAFLVFLAPDAIMSDGSFAAIERRMLGGAEMILLSGIRVTKETALPAIRERYRRPDGTIHMEAADLVDCAFEFPHPYTRSLVWGTERFNVRWPSQMFWFAPPFGILGHCWHLHPILVKARNETDQFLGTIDGDYIEQAGNRLQHIHVIEDSDEACLIEISREDHEKALLDTCAPFSLKEFLWWAQRATNPFHRSFISRPILFKGRAFREEGISAIRQEAAGTVGMLLKELENLIEIPLLRSFGELEDAPAVYLYGAGRCGQTILAHARRNGVGNIRGFLDTHRDGEADGLPVHRFDDYKERLRRPGDVIVIASMYVDDIARMLIDQGITPFFNALEMYNELQPSRPEEEADLVEFVIVPWQARPPVETGLESETV